MHIAWKQLLESQFIQKVIIIANTNPSTIPQIIKLYYNIGRQMLNTNAKPKTEKLLQHVFGDLRLYLISKYILLSTPRPMRIILMLDP
jgi:uncharacterized protein (DUF2062 family)